MSFVNNGHDILRRRNKEKLLKVLATAGFKIKKGGENIQIRVPDLAGVVAEISPFYALNRGPGKQEGFGTHSTGDFLINYPAQVRSPEYAQAQKIIHLLYVDSVWTDTGRLKD